MCVRVFVIEERREEEGEGEGEYIRKRTNDDVIINFDVLQD